ncbi:MAG: hypothetical protein IPM18_12885 [Phycisphaerales bacterium]|nr:hypothetical protein [Phycisphaerales bacterium]
MANFSDLSAFIFARGLTGTPEERAAAFAAVYPNCPYEMGDVNGDGLVDIADQSGFIALIQGTTAPVYDYAYDEENRLVAVTTIQGCPVLEIEYDALGRRVGTRDHGGDPDPCDAQVVMVYTRHIVAGFTPVVEFEAEDRRSSKSALTCGAVARAVERRPSLGRRTDSPCSPQ